MTRIRHVLTNPNPALGGHYYITFLYIFKRFYLNSHANCTEVCRLIAQAREAPYSCAYGTYAHQAGRLAGRGPHGAGRISAGAEMRASSVRIQAR